jgi:hypothetical protein
MIYGSLLFWGCPEKRSRALLGSNLARDIRADGAPIAASQPLVANTIRGWFLSSLGHPSLA